MIYKSYKDLCIEIELVKASIRQYKRNKEALQQRARIDGPREVKGIDYSRPSVQEGGTMDFGTYLKQLQRIESHLYLHRERLKMLEEDKNQRLRKLKSLEGLVYQVAYLREIKNMNLQEIADLMGYSYQYIKEVSSKTYF